MATTTLPTTPRKRTDLVYAMNGMNPAFNPGVDQQASPTSRPATLPNNYNFGDLANYETNVRNKFGQTASSDILSTRDSLAQSLNDEGKAFFDQQNPAILEDLNSRGLLTSQSEVANKTAQALKEIELSNQSYLRDFDTSALSARLQAQQDALDSGLDLRRGGLEQANANANSASEQALAEKLAKEQGRNQLTGSLIGAGGALLGGSLPYLLGGGGGAGAAGAAGAGAAGAGGAGAAAAGGAGLGGALGVGAIAGAGIGSAILSRAADKKVTEATGSGQAGTAAGVIASPIGAQLNFGKNLIKNPSSTVNKAFGIGAGSTSQQQNAIDVGTSENEQLNGILGRIQEKGGAGTFNEGQLYQAERETADLDKKLASGEMSKDEYFNIVSSYLPNLAANMSANMRSSQASAKAFNSGGFANRVIDMIHKLQEYAPDQATLDAIDAFGEKPKLKSTYASNIIRGS